MFLGKLALYFSCAMGLTVPCKMPADHGLKGSIVPDLHLDPACTVRQVSSASFESPEPTMVTHATRGVWRKQHAEVETKAGRKPPQSAGHV